MQFSRSRWYLAMVSSLCIVLISSMVGCQHAEPRWLMDRFPGDYPEVVYYFDTKAPVIALTIDDGPGPVATPQILDVLDQFDAHATFFLVSDRIQQDSALVKDIVSRGHELGHHMTKDEVTVKLPLDEFQRKFDEAERVLSNYAPIHWFRPGSAWFNEDIKKAALDQDYQIALASMIPFDARLPWPGFMVAYIKWSVEPGSIIVLHSVGARGQRTVAILQKLLPILQARGYEITTLSEAQARMRANLLQDATQEIVRQLN